MEEVKRRKIDAILHNACFQQGRVVGNIEADTSNRFKDGELIVSSEVMGRWGNVVYTKNSVYFIASERG